MNLVRWKNSSPYCWQSSIDGGSSWYDLQADNEEDSSEAIDEAAERFGTPTNQWELQD